MFYLQYKYGIVGLEVTSFAWNLMTWFGLLFTGERLVVVEMQCERLRMLYRDCARPPPPPLQADRRQVSTEAVMSILPLANEVSHWVQRVCLCCWSQSVWILFEYFNMNLCNGMWFLVVVVLVVACTVLNVNFIKYCIIGFCKMTSSVIRVKCSVLVYSPKKSLGAHQECFPLYERACFRHISQLWHFWLILVLVGDFLGAHLFMPLHQFQYR